MIIIWIILWIIAFAFAVSVIAVIADAIGKKGSKHRLGHKEKRDTYKERSICVERIKTVLIGAPDSAIYGLF